MAGQAWDPAAALEAERRRTLDRLTGLDEDYAGIVAASAGSNADDEHDPEGATIAFERSQVGALADQARRRLDEIDAAVARLRGGDYGVCGSCGTPIGQARLEARPTATTCITCAARS